MSSRKIVKKIKDAISRGSRSPSPEPGPSTPAIQVVFESSPSATFADFLDGELKEEYHKLVATSFAMYIREDSDAKVINLDDVFHFMGYKQKVKAVELLLKLYPETEPGEDEFSRSGKNRAGRKKI